MIKADSLFKAGAFKNVSFELRDGVLCVLSRKPERSSALLDTLSGVRCADGGELFGTESTAYLAKHCPLPQRLKVSEYLDFVSSLKGNAEIPEKVSELTEELLKAEIGSLSAVERLTVGLSASLIGEPNVIVIEEPYAALDYEEYADFKALVSSVSKNAPIIFSSSSVFECKEISDKTLVMSGEDQIYFGETSELFSSAINETDIICLVKGGKEQIISALERFSPSVSEAVRDGVFLVGIKDVPMFKAAETRSKIKKQLSKARLSLLEMKSEKEALLNIIGDLDERDKRRRSEYEENKPLKIEKITKALVSFSHDGDIDEEESESDMQSDGGSDDE